LSIPNNLRSRLLYTVDFNTNLIFEWKKHQLRSIHQEKARQYALEQLDNESIYVHMDWSMKFLPLKYREITIEWFGKRGLSWHITHVVRLRKSSSYSKSSNTRTYEHRSLVHVFNNCTQNGHTVGTRSIRCNQLVAQSIRRTSIRRNQFVAYIGEREH
jgi:hypothetical protein